MSTILDKLSRMLILEVERKFVPNSPALGLHIHQNRWPGSEPVKLTTPREGHRSTDVYYDTSNFCLKNARIYARKRNDIWKLRRRQSGDLVSTGCVEVCGKTLVGSVLTEAGVGARLADLGQVAEMGTVRRQWKISGFTVAVDDVVLFVQSCCGATYRIPHAVGEVELCLDVREEDVKERMSEMETGIDDFMERHERVFKGKLDPWHEREPEGKLAAYFRREKKVNKGFLPKLGWVEEKRRFLAVPRCMHKGSKC